ncbi:MAG: hydantoinase B/oxoprolinase family protein [Alphaproteobacteria bacterium]|nr:hydantoinase B/oxoprolinase family protein [Alphaproteobacteria bacterium]MDG1886830.1 hydantoinase B/oxoprolinase family protein [Alphaproteobacteria bacterium]
MTSDNIRHQVMWDRLITIVEEQAQTLIRTGFSVSTREAGDVSAGVFDLEGRMLAQAVTGTPGHINSMALSVKHFINKFPLKTMTDGDVYITNDPWKGTGHLHDIVVVTPTFRNKKLVALFACTTHVVDIGGLGMAPDGKQIYHEGLFIPLMYFMKAGQLNETLLDFVHHNCRESKQVEGDIYALANCNDVGGRRLIAMMEQYNIVELDELAKTIIESTKTAMRKAISKLPTKKVFNQMTTDGYDKEIILKASFEVCGDKVVVDFDGTSPISDFGINVPKCYTDAYTSFGVKCVIAPDVPNNAGSLEHIIIKAPEGCIVNAPHPCAVVARSSVGHMLPDVVFGCLYQLLPEKVPAEGTSCLWNLRLGAGHGITAKAKDIELSETTFTAMSFHSGGAGARPNKDGLSATPFPSGVRNVPCEVLEAITPIVIWKKELRQDSGGPGKYRGGLGQTMILGNRQAAEFAIFATFDRVKNPARGRNGGKPGANGSVELESGIQLKGMGRQVIPVGDRLIINMPGGGGFGDPKERAHREISADLKLGLISQEVAEREYHYRKERD